MVFVRYRACFLGGQVWGDFPGLCKILHETTPLGSYGTTWDSRRAYLSFGRVRFEWALLRVDRGSYWSTMVSGVVGSDSSLWVCRDQLRPSFWPWVAVKTSGEPDEALQALRWTISILSSAACFWLGVHGQVGIHGR